MYARKLYQSHNDVASEEHITVLKVLSSFWSALQTNLKSSGCLMLRLDLISFYVNTYILFYQNYSDRNFLGKYPFLFSKYPFQTDEWNRLNFTDYNGTYTEQPANTWFILLR